MGGFEVAILRGLTLARGVTIYKRELIRGFESRGWRAPSYRNVGAHFVCQVWSASFTLQSRCLELDVTLANISQS